MDVRPAGSSPSQRSASGAPGPAPAARERLSWVDHPARREPGRLILATGVILGVSLSVLWADGDLWLSALAALILMASIAPFLLPTRYTLTATEVIVQMPGRTRRRRWADLRRWSEGPGGFFLSPFDRPRGWVEGSRGIALRGGDRAAIRALLAARLGAAPGPTRGEEEG